MEACHYQYTHQLTRVRNWKSLENLLDLQTRLVFIVIPYQYGWQNEPWQQCQTQDVSAQRTTTQSTTTTNDLGDRFEMNTDTVYTVFMA
jgi:hypothetical protein